MAASGQDAVENGTGELAAPAVEQPHILAVRRALGAVVPDQLSYRALRRDKPVGNVSIEAHAANHRCDQRDCGRLARCFHVSGFGFGPLLLGNGGGLLRDDAQVADLRITEGQATKVSDLPKCLQP